MKNSAEDFISRKDFFALAFRKIRDTAVEHIVSTVDKFDEALDNEKNFEFICAIEDVDVSDPKQVIVKGKPYFCLKRAEKYVVLGGLCPQDGFPLQYYKLQGAIGCPLCNSFFELGSEQGKGKEQAQTRMNEYSTKIVENKVFAGI